VRVATDVGGTFTDVVCLRGNVITVAKTDTTPPNFEQGVLDAIARVGADPKDFDFFAHGTTVVINALLSRRGCKTALITTRGFRDVLEIARGNRPDLFNFLFEKPKPYVPRYLRYELTERKDPYGATLTPVDFSAVSAIVDDMKQNEVEAVAICLLHSYVNPEHERAVTAEIRKLWPDLSILASHEINREWREYERTSTTVLSAYVHPVAKRYLEHLGDRLEQIGSASKPYIMQSNGGVSTVAAAIDNPITMVESGPASGVLGAIVLGKHLEEPNLIALDVGGTTAKCALIENYAAKVTTQYRIECTRTNPGYPINTPVIELVEIGNGGGSIAWIDDGGKLHVGPVSAGAMPGPVSYGRGGSAPTTTDAHLLTGRIGAGLFMGGAVAPDLEATYAAFNKLGEQLGETAEATARGVIRIANGNMENALKLISVNKGYDPRDFTLVAFGGGGAMHAVDLAEALGISKVIIPAGASVFSAWGMLMTDLRRDSIRTHVLTFSPEYLAAIAGIYEEMADDVRAYYAADAIDGSSVTIRTFGDFRYVGQEHTVTIELPRDIGSVHGFAEAVERFHAAHEHEYSFRHSNTGVEIVNFHIAGIVEVPKPEMAKKPSTGRALAETVAGHRKVDYFLEKPISTSVYDLDRMEPGMSMTGPAIVENATTTIVVSPGKQVRMDDYGNIIITLHSE